MTAAPDAGERSWTSAVRGRITGLVPSGQALPDRQPAYVASWIYVFGVATMAALVVVVASGLVLAVGGAASNSSSWPWSCTCGASSGWPPGGANAG